MSHRKYWGFDKMLRLEKMNIKEGDETSEMV